MNTPELGQRLAHVLWMGGSPCSGKSSIAQVLASEYGLHTYHCDEAFTEHQQQITAHRQPMLHKWTHTAWTELWMQSPKVLVDEAIACYQEHFQLVVKDLLALPHSDPILAEGTCLLPDSVDPLLSSKEQAIWIVPTEAFQKAHYRDRGDWVEAILSECTDPELAFQNWMDRDATFARWLLRRTNELGLRTRLVDGTRTITQNARLVAGFLRL
jgi:2-phosphoglycerate kinase